MRRLTQIARVGPAIAYVALVFLFGVVPLSPPTPEVSMSDKVLHAVVFGGMVLIWLPALGGLMPRRPFGARVAAAFAVAAVAGASLEIVQWFFPPRTAELLDLVADVAGAALAGVAAAATERWLLPRSARSREAFPD